MRLTKRLGKKENRRNKRTSRKGRGYSNECIIPAPFHNRQDRESCRQVDLQDDYGDTVLSDKGLSGDKECNMYYYIHNRNYYRCRNAGKNKCNKTGEYGMKRMSCSPNSVNRILDENEQLDRELLDPINPSARFPSVLSYTPSAQDVYPTVPTHPSTSRISDVPSTLKRTSKSRVSPPRSSFAPSSSKRKRMMLSPESIKQLATSIDKLVEKNQEYEQKKQKLHQLLNNGKSRGNVTKQMEIRMAKQYAMIDFQIKKNQDIIKRNQAIINKMKLMVK